MMLWPVSRGGFSDPFGELNRLQREMNRLFNDAGGPAERFPAVNIWSDENKLELTAELPGVSSNDLNVTTIEDQLTIEGERRPDDVGEDGVYHRRERETGRFIRSFRLPFEVDSGKVEAKYADGVLRMTLPRAEVSKPKKISISAS